MSVTNNLLSVAFNLLPNIEMTQAESSYTMLPMVEDPRKLPMNDVSPKHSDFAERLNELMERPSSQIRSVNQLKDAAGITYEMARRYTLGISKPRDEKLRKIATLLGVSVSYLDNGDGHVSTEPQLMNPIQVDGLYHSPGMPLPEFARISQYPDGRIFVPIIGDATMGPDGFFEEYGVNSRYGDGYVQAPFNVSPYSYGLRGVGGCMHPAIRDGWLVIFDPEAQPMPTEYVHVCLKDGRQTIKEFIGLHDGILTLMAVNTGERITFKNDQVLGMATCVFIVSPSRRISELPEMDFRE